MKLFDKMLFGSIHDAAKKGNVAKVRRLLKAAPGLVNIRKRNGETPLHLAAKGGHMAVSELLLASGAEISAKESHGWTPLPGERKIYHEQ